ncbi:MAG TPA: 3-hydroxybutyryl-CoA dehydrogenase [Actinomycetota bacterium]|nr:3-hydroxybutyryl-CoA dehydrogenase [Actinomycetota bacterium]
MNPGDVRTAGVVGCGIMGSGIVEVCAKAGMRVVFVEANDQLVSRGQGAIERSMAKAVQRGKLAESSRDEALGRITGSTDFKDLAEADLVIEAVVEDPGAKRDVFHKLDELTRPEVILASNTSSIPIVELASVTKRPDKVVGMHFFNPPPVMPLLEVVRALTTSDETVEFARGMGDRLGKTTVLSKDRAGFIVNYLLVPYLNFAARMYEEGFASAEDIDTAIKLGLSHPMGPLTLLDFIGIDTAVHVAEVLYEEFKEPMFAPPAILKRMVSTGWLGRKTGRGFYEYDR